MTDISIIFCTDNDIKEKIKSVIGSWSKKGLLKNFIFVDSFENNQYQSSECINGMYMDLEDLKLLRSIGDQLTVSRNMSGKFV